jgi:hypothetical protein
MAWYFTVISLTDEGDENWVFRYPCGFVDNLRPSNAIVYGLDNNIYAAGKCSLPDRSEDFFVVSLSTAGDTNWTYQLNGSAGDDDRARALGYGSDGNIYVAGMVKNAGSGEDFAVLSLGADGTENWLYTYSALPSYRWDEAYAIDCGWDGNIYAVGEGSSAGGFWDYNFTVVSLEPTTGVEETKTNHTQLIRIEATPNPFSKLTKIRCSILDTRYSIENPNIRIYDATGRLVRSFNQESSIPGLAPRIGAGEIQVSDAVWDGLDNYGNPLPSGVYFIHIQSSRGSQSLPVVLLK